MLRALKWSALFFVAVLTLIATAAGRPSEPPGRSKIDARTRWTMARLRAGDSIEKLRKEKAPLNKKGEMDVFIVGSLNRKEAEAQGGRVRTSLPGVMTAFLPPAAVEALARHPRVVRIEGSTPVRLDLDAAVPTTNAPNLRGPAPTFTGIAGQGVVIGDVDTGIDFGHGDFKNPDGTTRLLYIWDQTDNAGPDPADPDDPQYGTEWTAAQINAGGVRQYDLEGHGTHVLSIAGGDGSTVAGGQPPFIGMAPKADLIMIKSNFSTTGIVDGVEYVFNRAADLGKPAVVNLSLSAAGGPRDGSSPFETALNALVGPGRIVTKSAGNGGLLPVHAEATLGNPIGLELLQGTSVGDPYFVLEGYYEASERLLLTIYPPGASPIGPIAVGAAFGNPASWPPGQLMPGGYYVYAENGQDLTATNDKRVDIWVTQDPASPGSGLMDGTWQFTLVPETAPGPTNGEIDLWIYTGGTADTLEFTTPTRTNEEMIGEPGNAPDVITVASWATKRYWTDCHGTPNIERCNAVDPGNLSPFSSRGPTRDGRLKPEIAAPGSIIAAALKNSDGAVTCPAIPDPPICPVDVEPDAPCPIDLDALVCTVPPNHPPYLQGLMYWMLQGTSMSAPMAAGASALVMQKCGPVTPTFLKNYFASHALTDSFTGTVWNKEWGAGKLRLDSLTNPVVQVTFPNGGGGQNFTIGNPLNIQWTATASCGVSHVNILLSRTGVGGPYNETIASAVPNTGSRVWTVTGPATLTASIKVVAVDSGNNTGSDTSNFNFRIKNPACPGPCTPPSSYCREEGLRCTHNGTCGVGGCCNFICQEDLSCTGVDPCPSNVCGGC